MSFEILEHTADIGIRAWGTTFEEMLANAGLALVSIALDIDSVEAREPYPIAARGEDPESLVVNWLNEVLYYVDGRRIGFRRFEIRKAQSGEAAGIGWGEPRAGLDQARLIVKGVTYHLLRVAQHDGQWMCEVYLDI